MRSFISIVHIEENQYLAKYILYRWDFHWERVHRTALHCTGTGTDIRRSYTSETKLIGIINFWNYSWVPDDDERWCENIKLWNKLIRYCYKSFHDAKNELNSSWNWILHLYSTTSTTRGIESINYWFLSWHQYIGWYKMDCHLYSSWMDSVTHDLDMALWQYANACS